MNPDLQFALLILAIFAFYYIYWLVKTLQENKKIRQIRAKGEAYTVLIHNIDSNIKRMGNRFNIMVKLDLPTGMRTIQNYPKIRRSPYQAGSEIDIVYSKEHPSEFIFAEERVLKYDRPFSVSDGDRISPFKLIIRTLITWAIAAAVIVLGIYFFGVNGVYYQ